MLHNAACSILSGYTLIRENDLQRKKFNVIWKKTINLDVKIHWYRKGKLTREKFQNLMERYVQAFILKCVTEK